MNKDVTQKSTAGAPLVAEQQKSSGKIPGNIGERLISGIEHFESEPPTATEKFVFEVLRACARQGLLFLPSEVACERFSGPDDQPYARYIFDISIMTRANFAMQRPVRRSVYVPFTGEDTAYQAQHRLLADFLSLLLGLEPPKADSDAPGAPLPDNPALTGKQSANRKFQLLDQIERTATPVSLRQLMERNKVGVRYLWRNDRKEVGAAAEKRLADMKAGLLGEALEEPHSEEEKA